MKSGIYKIKNLLNGMCYIGSSVNIQNRFYRHINSLNQNNHHNILLQRAWNKYGSKAFVFGVIEYTDEKIYDKEQNYINLYNSDTRKYGYNICKANEMPRYAQLPKITKTNLKKIQSENMKERWKNNEEYRKKMSRTGIDNPNYISNNPLLICPLCNGKKARISINCMKCTDRTGKNNGFYGKKISKEHSQKISEALKGKKCSEKSKQITTKRNIENSKIVIVNGNEYRSIKIACEFEKLTHHQIRYRIRSINYPDCYFKQ